MAEYYKAYDERYKKVKESGAGIWGTSENDPFVTSTLEKWVKENALEGRACFSAPAVREARELFFRGSAVFIGGRMFPSRR